MWSAYGLLMNKRYVNKLLLLLIIIIIIIIIIIKRHKYLWIKVLRAIWLIAETTGRNFVTKKIYSCRFFRWFKCSP